MVGDGRVQRRRLLLASGCGVLAIGLVLLSHVVFDGSDPSNSKVTVTNPTHHLRKRTTVLTDDEEANAPGHTLRARNRRSETTTSLEEGPINTDDSTNPRAPIPDDDGRQQKIGIGNGTTLSAALQSILQTRCGPAKDGDDDGDAQTSASVPLNIRGISPADSAQNHPLHNTVRAFHASCPFRDGVPSHARPIADDVSPEAAAYLRRHVLVGVVTGSFGNFSRLDLAYCTWLSHVPADNLFIASDRVELVREETAKSPMGTTFAADAENVTTPTSGGPSSRRRGHWLKGQLPVGARFSRRQEQAKGYTIHWYRAQYRFVTVLAAMVRRATGRPVQGLRYQREDSDSLDEQQGEMSSQQLNFMPDAEGKGADSGKGTAVAAPPRGPSSDVRWAVVVDDDTFININAMVAMLQQMDRTHGHQATYVGDRGWGGGGHLFNRPALETAAKELHKTCIEPLMIRQFHASDVTLTKCLPRMRIRVVNSKLVSHCQANFLRERLIRPDHVSAHVKRDLTGPIPLQLLRSRLYYQSTYKRNHTCAYALLMHLGACAYGSSCKLSRCGPDHDALALQDGLALVSAKIHV